MKTQFENKVIFITGASSGIGRSLAKKFISYGAKVAIVARRMDKLSELAKELDVTMTKIFPVEGDVTNEASIQLAAQKTREHFGRIDIVIANAGFGVRGRFDEINSADYRRQFETNVFGVLNTIHATLNDLKKSRGQIVIMGSVRGHISLAGHSAYSMSKFAIRALAYSLRAELLPSGISVTLLSPGFVESEIRSVDRQGTLHKEKKDWVPSWLLMPADKAAEAMTKAIAKKKKEQAITLHGQWAIFLSRHFFHLTSFITDMIAMSLSKP
ncbi:MAG: SDR family NAD(P)-dependent oxidoreductase [Pseudobdellovibrionaceae bacterium]